MSFVSASIVVFYQEDYSSKASDFKITLEIGILFHSKQAEKATLSVALATS